MSILFDPMFLILIFIKFTTEKSYKVLKEEQSINNPSFITGITANENYVLFNFKHKTVVENIKMSMINSAIDVDLNENSYIKLKDDSTQPDFNDTSKYVSIKTLYKTNKHFFIFINNPNHPALKNNDVKQLKNIKFFKSFIDKINNNQPDVDEMYFDLVSKDVLFINTTEINTYKKILSDRPNTLFKIKISHYTRDNKAMYTSISPEFIIRTDDKTSVNYLDFKPIELGSTSEQRIKIIELWLKENRYYVVFGIIIPLTILLFLFILIKAHKERNSQMERNFMYNK